MEKEATMSSLTRALTVAAVGLTGLVIGVAPAAATPAAVPSAQDARYLRQAHEYHLAEITVGRLAEQMGASQTVRDLGAMFVTDHTRLDASLRTVAAELNVSLPATSTAAQQGVAARLSRTSGADFDELFVTSQRDGHLQAIGVGQAERDEGSDPQARQVASDAAVVLDSHHRQLEEAAIALGLPTEVNTGTGGLAAAGGSKLVGGLLLAVGFLLFGAGMLGRRRRLMR
jgi:putative membrane protein